MWHICIVLQQNGEDNIWKDIVQMLSEFIAHLTPNIYFIILTCTSPAAKYLSVCLFNRDNAVKLLHKTKRCSSYNEYVHVSSMELICSPPSSGRFRRKTTPWKQNVSGQIKSFVLYCTSISFWTWGPKTFSVNSFVLFLCDMLMC